MTPIPYVDLPAQHAAIEGEILEAVRRVLRHGWFILGPEVQALEEALAERVGVRHAVGVGNGTDALVLALRAHGVGPGHEVITVSHSFFATASAIELVGAVPVFVDIHPDTLLMDPDLLEAARTPRTRAVIPVHLMGHPCDMDAIGAFCQAHGLALIEDAAQAIDARWRGRAVGSFGTGCFSLHPLKNFAACGDAGFVTTDDDDLAAFLRQARNIGICDRDHCDFVSSNSRLDALHAAGSTPRPIARPWRGTCACLLPSPSMARLSTMPSWCATPSGIGCRPRCRPRASGQRSTTPSPSTANPPSRSVLGGLWPTPTGRWPRS
jgi:dTDP-4-amino-4,6-dideoxygalactose transaminase